MTIVLVYVDDIISTGDYMREIAKLKSFLHGKFSIKDLGTLRYCFGIEIAHSKKGLFLTKGSMSWIC